MICIDSHNSHALSDNYECTPEMINSFFLSGTEDNLTEIVATSERKFRVCSLLTA